MEDELDTAQSPTAPTVYSVGEPCLARIGPNDEWRPAEVVDRRRNEQKEASSEWQYYIHFQQLNRRLDRWCDDSQLRPEQPNTAVDAAAAPTTSPYTSPILRATSAIPSPYSSPAAAHQPHTEQQQPVSLSAAPLSQPAASASSPTVDRRLTRRDRRLLEEEDDELEYSDEGELEIEKEHAEKTKVRNIQTVHIATPTSHTASNTTTQPQPSIDTTSHSTSAVSFQGPPASSLAVPLSSSYSVDCWYFSPYPVPYRHMSQLYLCGLCLSYFDSSSSLVSHFLSRCSVYHPPGHEIYRDDGGGISLFCVDGALSALWCQCLCLCAKLFLDHKTAIFDCEQFLFFPIVRWLPGGYELLGYFSRSKNSFATSSDSHNVACLLTFPHHQQRGYGRLLIAASYALSRVEGRVGRPERPLSDMGRVSYRRWWTEQLMEALAQYVHGSSVMVAELSEQTAIQREDVVSVLRDMDMGDVPERAVCVHRQPAPDSGVERAAASSGGVQAGRMAM